MPGTPIQHRRVQRAAKLAAAARLQNPHNDITLIGAALEKLNFKVTLVRDADYRSTNAAIKRHIAALRREGQAELAGAHMPRR